MISDSLGELRESFAVDFSSMAHFYDFDDKGIVDDFVKYAVIPYSNPVSKGALC